MLTAGSRRQNGRGSDSGAVAVEFALLLPLLMLLLFGIIQYGYGLFQLQAITSVVGEATQKATTGVTDCDQFQATLRTLVEGSGLDPDAVTRFDVQWLTQAGDESAAPDPLGLVKVTTTYTPFKIGIPFVPFPDSITRSQIGTVQNIGSLDLAGCHVGL